MKEIKAIKRAKRLNPLVVFLYGLGCYHLSELAHYGGVRRRVPIILLSFSLLLGWFIYLFIKSRRQPASGVIYPQEPKTSKKERLSNGWFYVAIVLLIIITGWTGFRIYHSAIPYNGKLSWVIEDYFHTKEVAFEQNNIYSNGLNGMLSDIKQEMTLPDELYVSGSFRITYTDTGEISDLDGFLYGLNEENETQSFLLSYEGAESNNIHIHLNGYVEATFDETKRFQPLVEALTIIELQPLTDKLVNNEIDLHYEGYRTIQEAFDPIYYYNDEGLTPFVNSGQGEHIGYSFTLKSPDKQMHFIEFDEEVLLNQQRQQQDQA